jgi:hypothetical protein
MEKMRLMNEQLVARRLRTEADENLYKENEEARQIARKEQHIKMKQKKEDNSRIQSAIEYDLQIVADYSSQRDEARQKKLGRVLEWDQDKPTLEEDGIDSPLNQC